MSRHFRRTGFFVAILLLALVAPVKAFVLVEDQFDVTVSPIASSKPAITNAYFFRGYTDPSGASAGQIIAIRDLSWGTDNSLIGLLLPAVQKTHEAASVVGFCDGSVLVGMADGSVRPIVGNADFDFQATFGVPEADLITALQGGDTNSIIAVLDTAYVGGLLPAVQMGTPSGGTMVNFSAPTEAGTFTVTETPEPAGAGLLVTLAVALCSRRPRRA